jgi:hypothetical protein
MSGCIRYASTQQFEVPGQISELDHCTSQERYRLQANHQNSKLAKRHALPEPVFNRGGHKFLWAKRPRLNRPAERRATFLADNRPFNVFTTAIIAFFQSSTPFTSILNKLANPLFCFFTIRLAPANQLHFAIPVNKQPRIAPAGNLSSIISPWKIVGHDLAIDLR